MGTISKGDAELRLSGNGDEQMNKLHLDILIGESTRAAKAIDDMVSNQNKLLPTGFALMTTGYAYALNYGGTIKADIGTINATAINNMNNLIIMFPLIIFVFMVYYLDVAAEYYSMGGYKKFVDERINKIFEDNLLLPWETMIAPKRHKDIMRIFVEIMILLIIAYTSYNSYSLVRNKYGQSYGYLAISLSIVIILILGCCHLHKYRSFDKIYELLKDKHKTNSE
ncbi:MAG: hypothetical protein HQK96_17755 [Nitrospirae bacterium]|nr:hypothetical protein [Nitrospirota bacterium]